MIQIEIPASDFEAMLSAYERKGWKVVGYGVSSITFQRGCEQRTLIRRLGE